MHRRGNNSDIFFYFISPHHLVFVVLSLFSHLGRCVLMVSSPMVYVSLVLIVVGLGMICGLLWRYVVWRWVQGDE